jgi:hypothetical protein
VSPKKLLWVAVVVVALVAAILVPRAVRRDVANRARPAAGVAEAPPAPEPDPSAWRGGVEPTPIAPGVLARVAPRRPPPPPAGPPECRDPTAGCGDSTVPAACPPDGERKSAGVGAACDKEGDGVEAIEIDWSAGDDP